jgi:hypothetical protein
MFFSLSVEKTFREQYRNLALRQRRLPIQRADAKQTEIVFGKVPLYEPGQLGGAAAADLSPFRVR